MAHCVITLTLFGSYVYKGAREKERERVDGRERERERKR